MFIKVLTHTHHHRFLKHRKGSKEKWWIKYLKDLKLRSIETDMCIYINVCCYLIIDFIFFILIYKSYTPPSSTLNYKNAPH